VTAPELSFITVAPLDAFTAPEYAPPSEVYWVATTGTPRVYACFYNLEDAKEYLVKVKGQKEWEIAVHTRTQDDVSQ